MPDSLAERFGLGPIDQVAYVVDDLDRSIGVYAALFGSFEVGDFPLQGCDFRGESVDCCLRLAVCKTGPVEIELIQVMEGETPHTEHLRTHGEGLHHVRFRVDDLDRKLTELNRAGFQTVFHKRLAPKIAFAYLEAPTELGGSVIELLEL